jgi:hypothetical protein
VAVEATPEDGEEAGLGRRIGLGLCVEEWVCAVAPHVRAGGSAAPFLNIFYGVCYLTIVILFHKHLSFFCNFG